MTQFLPRAALGLLLAVGVATAAVAATAQPAQAGVVVSVGFGGGYAPGYRWYRWHDGYGWHRRWVPLGWAPPVAFFPAPRYGYPVPVVYGRSYFAPRYAGWYRYGRPYFAPRYAGWYRYGHPAFRR